jgi:hypothetical protein
MDYENILKQLQDYYSNTLIIQYNGKPKAKATIEMLVQLVYMNAILMQIRDAFDWKTAVGKQLDIIGQWVGVSRIYQQNNISGKTYLAYPGWDDETDTLQHGYSNYATFDTDTGNDLTYKELETLEATLNDDDYRTVIGLKIIKNNINHTAKNIDDAIWEYFNGQVYTTWTDYEITYHYPAELTTIIEVCNAKNVLLAPIGVNINLLQTE